jgi:putative endonuclease
MDSPMYRICIDAGPTRWRADETDKRGDILFFVYIAQCGDGSLYTGWTTDLEKRMAAHNAGRGAKYTRSKRPVTLLYHEEMPSINEALRREIAIKRLSHENKRRLIGVAD